MPEIPSGYPDVLVALQVPVLPSPWTPEPDHHIVVDRGLTLVHPIRNPVWVFILAGCGMGLCLGHRMQEANSPFERLLFRQ